MVKEILKNNERTFLADLKRVHEVMTYASKTDAYFKITKGELLRKAATSEIRYFITDKIFVQKRNSMVVI